MATSLHALFYTDVQYFNQSWFSSPNLLSCSLSHLSKWLPILQIAQLKNLRFIFDFAIFPTYYISNSQANPVNFIFKIYLESDQFILPLLLPLQSKPAPSLLSITSWDRFPGWPFTISHTSWQSPPWIWAGPVTCFLQQKMEMVQG